jgi:peptidoglycan/xylan/chitin deacetylase (PgdA/CDA1 family)
MIHTSLINNSKLRVPQSLKIEPSTGPAGNITGNSFPRGVWAITFDDGPHPVYTNQIVNNLKENDIKSTFFSLSKNVLQYPKITKGIQALGMEIANHSHDHPQLIKLNDAQLDFQILNSTDKIESVTGEKPRFFRCPYGAGTNVPRIRSRIAKEEMVHVFWSVDSLDWQDRNPDSIVKRVQKQISLSKNGGGVILFHDIHPQSVTASKVIMKYLKEGEATPGKVNQVKTIGEIVDMINN